MSGHRSGQTPVEAGLQGVRVLVTGGAGFIGSRLVDHVSRADAEVHLASRRQAPRDAAGEWHGADLSNSATAEELIRRVKPDVVFHLSSAVTGSRDVSIVLATLQANLVAAVNLMVALTKHRPDARLVLAGSIEEAGDHPISPYSAAKRAATEYAQLFAHLWDLRVTTLRIAMVYGPGQSDLTKLVPYVTTTLLRGEDASLSSGTRLVDWVYVDDVARAFVLAAQADGAAGRAIDICSGRLTSVADIAMMLRNIVGGPGTVRLGGRPDRPLDENHSGDPTVAERVLGWQPVTELRDGLRETVSWFAARSQT
jgi:nucleoside-diphosphate-sugar epimerase